jgi:hypothetical protein
MPIELLELLFVARRRYCQCCGYPTLGVPDGTDGEPEWDVSATACDLCEWDSAPLNVDGEPLTSSDEERNDGLTLDVARQQVEQHGNIYDPASPALWKVSTPSAQVVQTRGALRAVYDALLDASVAERLGLWETVEAAERELAAAMASQRDQDEAFTNEAFPDDAVTDGAP